MTIVSCELRGRYPFNKDIGEFGEELKEIFNKCKEELMKETTLESNINIINNELHVSLSSKESTSHSIFYRIKKSVMKEIGKKYRIGIKSVIIDYYKIIFQLENKSQGDIKIPFVSQLKFLEDKKCLIILENLDETIITQNYIERIISLINKKVNDQYYEGKDEYWELMSASNEKDHAWNLNPTDEMVKMKWLKRGPTKGKWFYRPQIVAIFNAMKEIARNEILDPLNFQEIIESNFVSFDVWLKTGHLGGVPNEIYYYSEPKSKNPDLWQEFQDYIYIAREVPINQLKQLISEPKGGLIYAQCPNIYWSFTNTVLPINELPLKIFENKVVSARYESSGRHGIERGDEFHRIEIVYIGTANQLIDLRKKILDRYKYVFDEILDIEWRMAWVTPWYMAQSGSTSGIEETDKKILGTIDFEAFLPFKGNKNNNESWLEFQNYTISGEKFTKAFNIKSQKEELWSGCSGIGIQRWTAVFLAQHGLDPNNWPSKFQEYLNKLPKGFTFL